MIEFDNRRWEAELRQVSCLKQCRFPANSEIEMGGTLEQAKITMKEKGLNGNMQSDAAAFESWALALLLHCGVQTVQIGMDPRADRKGPHYERFLYRLKRFSELYPDWVIAEEPDPPSKALSRSNRRDASQFNSSRCVHKADFIHLAAGESDLAQIALEEERNLAARSVGIESLSYAKATDDLANFTSFMASHRRLSRCWQRARKSSRRQAFGFERANQQTVRS